MPYDSPGATPIDASSYIVGARFIPGANRVRPIDPFTGQVVLTFAPNLPAGTYTLTVHRPEPGFGGVTDAAGNAIDGNASTPGAQDYSFSFNYQAQPSFIQSYQALSPAPGYALVDLQNTSSYVSTGPRSYYETPAPGVTARADAPPTTFVVDFSNPLLTNS